MFISAIQELSFHRKTGVTLKWRTRFLLCVEQCSKDSILLMCVECIPALYPYGNSWVVGKALWHIKTRHHQDFHLDDAWFMFSNPVRQMPYMSNFRGLLFYDHPSKAREPVFAVTIPRDKSFIFQKKGRRERFSGRYSPKMVLYRKKTRTFKSNVRKKTGFTPLALTKGFFSKYNI